jgi:replicative DNA helicase
MPEKALLGSLVLDNSLWRQSSVSTADFLLSTHQEIFGTVGAMLEDGRAADLVTVTVELSSQGKLESCGGAAYLSDLIHHALPENYGSYVRIVRMAATERRIAHQIEMLSKTASIPGCQKFAALREQTRQLNQLVATLAEFEVRRGR